MDQGFTIWLTGLSGAGKSTVSDLVAERLQAVGMRVEVLDGDAVRAGLNTDLGFSREHRETNVRRLGWLCEMLNRHGVVAIVAAISPYRATREEVRARLPRFAEVHMDCDVEILAARDVKGLYKRALAGEIPAFTGVSDPYEAPTSPEVVCRSDGTESPAACAERILDFIRKAGWLSG